MVRAFTLGVMYISIHKLGDIDSSVQNSVVRAFTDGVMYIMVPI